MRMNSESFKPGDTVEWLFPNGDKALCTVKEIQNDESMWVIWHKDNFVNIMPKNGFERVENE
jgi:hypothetical protein